MNLVINAAQFADRAHRGQLRKWSSTDYITHPARVASRVTLDNIASEITIAASWLHDVVEDCEVSILTIKREFGFEVASLVCGLTNEKKTSGSLLSREEIKKRDRDRLSAMCHDVKVIKAIDRIDNLNELTYAPKHFKDIYISESKLLWEVLYDAADLRLRIEFNAALTRLGASLS